MLIIPCTYFSSSGGRAFNALGSLVSSTVCDMDATLEPSFASGQKWLNLEGTPADGSSQTDNDFFLGANGDGGGDSADPEHTGTVDDAAAYFLMDGTDYFTSVDGVGSSNAITLRDLHKNGSGEAWWIAMVMKTATLSNTFFWGNANAAGGDGMRWFANNSGTNIRVDQFDGTSSTSADSLLTLVSDTDQLVIISCDMNATSNNVRRWRNTATKNEISKTWNSASGNTDGVFRIGATDNQGTVSGALIDVNSRIYAFSYGNAFIGDTEAAALKTEYEARHGRTYDT